MSGSNGRKQPVLLSESLYSHHSLNGVYVFSFFFSFFPSPSLPLPPPPSLSPPPSPSLLPSLPPPPSVLPPPPHASLHPSLLSFWLEGGGGDPLAWHSGGTWDCVVWHSRSWSLLNCTGKSLLLSGSSGGKLPPLSVHLALLWKGQAAGRVRGSDGGGVAGLCALPGPHCGVSPRLPLQLPLPRLQSAAPWQRALFMAGEAGGGRRDSPAFLHAEHRRSAPRASSVRRGGSRLLSGAPRSVLSSPRSCVSAPTAELVVTSGCGQHGMWDVSGDGRGQRQVSRRPERVLRRHRRRLGRDHNRRGGGLGGFVFSGFQGRKLLASRY